MPRTRNQECELGNKHYIVNGVFGRLRYHIKISVGLNSTLQNQLVRREMFRFINTFSNQTLSNVERSIHLEVQIALKKFILGLPHH